MNIVVLHGDHIEKSYFRLARFKEVAVKRGWEIFILNTSSRESLSQVLVSRSLFAKSKFVVLEDPPLLSKKELGFLKKRHEEIEGTLIFYNQGILSKTFLDVLPRGAKVEEYKLPKLIFSFFESFYPGNTKKCVGLFHELIENEPLEFIFALLGRYIRDLYWVKKDRDGLKYPSWRIRKLESQSAKFSGDLLRRIISDLAEADVKSKTSNIALELSLDLIIAKHLE